MGYHVTEGEGGDKALLSGRQLESLAVVSLGVSSFWLPKQVTIL